MLRIGICDDEVRAREQLRVSLQTILRQDDAGFFEFSGGEGAVHWLQNHPGELDVLFLDIEMRGIDGMETARQIRTFDHNLILVFVTGYEDYVFDGYSVQAMDYLLKPVREERLRLLLDRVETRLALYVREVYTVQSAGSLLRVPHRDILYAFSDRRQVTLVTGAREYTFYEKLDALHEALGADFIRIHQRYLVQARTVTRVEGETLWIGEIELPVSRALRQTVFLRLAREVVGGDAHG